MFTKLRSQGVDVVVVVNHKTDHLTHTHHYSTAPHTLPQWVVDVPTPVCECPPGSPTLPAPPRPASPSPQADRHRHTPAHTWCSLGPSASPVLIKHQLGPPEASRRHTGENYLAGETQELPRLIEHCTPVRQWAGGCVRCVAQV